MMDHKQFIVGVAVFLSMKRQMLSFEMFFLAVEEIYILFDVQSATKSGMYHGQLVWGIILLKSRNVAIF
jgi:hypothetical protein